MASSLRAPKLFAIPPSANGNGQQAEQACGQHKASEP